MQSKYKVGLLRANLLLAGLFPALMVPGARNLSEGLLLGLAATWLGLSALLVEFSHRRPPMVPWQLLPSLLLAALLWSLGDRYPFWLWAWAALMMLPQPGWMAAFNVLLAALSWAWLARLLPPQQALASGLCLALLLALGFNRARWLLPRHGQVRRRVSLVPGLRLWPGARLADDLPRERGRAQRDGTHTELLLLRTRRRWLWVVARRLCELTRRFEPCYRLDGRTLATLLVCRDADQARQRRETLLGRLPSLEGVHALPLSRVDSLAEARRELERQASATGDTGAPSRDA